MNEQENELVELLANASADDIEFIYTAKAIIAKYPQITKKPVKMEAQDALKMDGTKMYLVGKLYDFKSTVERQEWIDTHYVEVEG